MAENQPIGTGVGTLTTTDPDAGDTHTYALVPGNGSADNGSFAINGATLETAAVLDFETKSSYFIRVRTTDSTTRFLEEEFVITATNVNEAPTDIGLSNATVAENQVSGTTVGTLSTTDPDAGDTHTYSLEAGTGSADNGSFTIVGATLNTNAVFNFEVKSLYSIRVRTTDGLGQTFEEAFTISVTNVNETPTDIGLSSASVAENQPSGTTVGALSTTDVDVADTHTYTLVAGTGSTDNASFTIVGTSLRTNAVFNFEAKNSYSIRVRTTDAGSLTFEEVFTISVTNVNEAPTDIGLTNASVAENQPSGTTVGTLSTSDVDAGEAHTYSLVAGAGSTDNGSFAITGSSLQTNAVFNFESKNSYSIRVRTTDGGSLFFEEVFVISVTNVNEAPTDIGLSNASVAENQVSGTTVGTLSTTDPDAGDTHTYSLVAGTGSTDNGSFTIVGASLNTNAVFNFEVKSSYSIRVRTTDGGALTFEEVFVVSVTNVNEAPTDIALTNSSIAENQVSGTTVGTLSTTDPDAGSTHTYSLVAGAGSADNASFTIVGSDLRTNAVFDFETKSSYSIRVRTTDAGALTFEEVFTISVTNVNDAPVNAVPGAQAVNEDTDLTFSSGGGNALSVADVDAAVGSVQTTVSALNGTITPMSGSGATVTGSGTASAQITGTLAQVNAALNGLRYRGTSNWNSSRGSETLTIVTNDQGNSGPGGAKSDTDTVGITVNAVNDAPSAAAKSYTVQANMKIVGLSGLLTGATDPDTGDGGYMASFTVNDVLVDTCAASSTISNIGAAAGTFDFDPQPGFSGTCTLRYRVNDSGNPGPAAPSAFASITLTVNGPVIWFVNAAAAPGGNGRLSSPFQTLAAADAVDAASHGIFLYSGTYANGITLNASEKLVGQGTTGTTFDAVFGITPPAGTLARPALATGTATVQGTVTLASSTLLRGLALSTGASAGLTGSGGLTGIDVAQVSVTTTTGTAVNLNNAAGSYSFSTISTNGAANGILLDTLGASSFTATAGSIVNASTRGVDVNGGSGSFSYGGAISTSGGGRSVEITNRTGGTATLGGAVTDTGSGISLSSNAGATITFSGGITASTGANPAFAATGGGTVNVTGTNTLATTTGTALNVSNTTIGTSGVIFRSISANGAANGIILNSTGSSGAFTVTGDGSTTGGLLDRDGSGGTINGTAGHAVSLTNANNVTLRQMNITNTAAGGACPGSCTANGVNSSGGTSIVLSAVLLQNLGGHGWYGVNLGGTNIFDQNGRVQSWQTNNSWGIYIDNTNTNFTSFTVSNNVFTTSATGADAFLLDANGASSGTVNVTSNEFTLIDQDAVQVNNDGSGAITAVVQKNNFHDSDATSGDGNNTLFMALSGSGNLNFTIGGPTAADGNAFTNTSRLQTLAGIVQVNAAGGSTSVGTLNGSIQHNTITNPAFNATRRGIMVAAEASAGNHGAHNVLIANNSVQNLTLQGIYASITSLNGWDVLNTNFTIRDNQVGNLGAIGSGGGDGGSAIEYETNAAVANTSTNFSGNLLIQNNTAVSNNNSGVGGAIEINNRHTGGNNTSVLNVTVLGNSITQSNAAGETFELLNSAGDGTGAGPSTCLDLNSGNTSPNNSVGGTGGFKLTNNLGTFSIEGMGASTPSAFLGPRNQNNGVAPATITAVGTFTSSPGCSTPP